MMLVLALIFLALSIFAMALNLAYLAGIMALAALICTFAGSGTPHIHL
jgi:hypothetical protein